MWQVVGDAARAAGRFARRHRRAIVVGGVVGAAACVYHSMKKTLKEVTRLCARMGECVEGRRGGVDVPTGCVKGESSCLLLLWLLARLFSCLSSLVRCLVLELLYRYAHHIVLDHSSIYYYRRYRYTACKYLVVLLSKTLKCYKSVSAPAAAAWLLCALHQCSCSTAASSL